MNYVYEIDVLGAVAIKILFSRILWRLDCYKFTSTSTSELKTAEQRALSSTEVLVNFNQTFLQAVFLTVEVVWYILMSFHFNGFRS